MYDNSFSDMDIQCNLLILNLLGTSLCVRNRQVFTVRFKQIKLTKISYIGTLFSLVYTGFHFIIYYIYRYLYLFIYCFHIYIYTCMDVSAVLILFLPPPPPFVLLRAMFLHLVICVTLYKVT